MNRTRLLPTILTFLTRQGVRLHDIRAKMTLAWAINGVILGKSVNLPRWIEYLQGEQKAASQIRRFSRWLHNPRIQVWDVYQASLRQLFAEWKEPLLIALDTTVLWDTYVVVKLSLTYRGRGIPLHWIVLERSSPTVKLEAYQHLLIDIADLLPRNRRVILLADRGFMDTCLMKLCCHLGWHFRIRAKGNTWCHIGSSQRQFQTFVPAKGRAVCVHNVFVTNKRFGPVHAAIARPEKEDPWIIISSEPTDAITFTEYGLRYDIEELFLDEKSGGFQLESSKIRDKNAISRLLLVMAFATQYLVSTGTAITEMGHRQIVDPHWSRGLSYFQIGLRWIKHALTNGKKLLDFLWLSDTPDPEVVFASKRQREKRLQQNSFTLTYL